MCQCFWHINILIQYCMSPIVSYYKVSCIISLHISHETTVEKYCLAAIRRVFSPYCDVHVSTQWLWWGWRLCMLLGALAKLAGRENRLPFPQCAVGAPELTSELLLPLLDCSCQSWSTHAYVITTTNASTTTTTSAASSNKRHRLICIQYIQEGTHKHTIQ